MNKMMMGAVGAVVGMTAFGDVVPTAYVSEAGRDIVAQSTHVTLDAAYRFDLRDVCEVRFCFGRWLQHETTWGERHAVEISSVTVR